MKTKSSAEAPVLTLPDSPSETRKSLSDYSMLLYGDEKIGKTTLAAQFPEAFFMMCEPGGKALSIYQKPVNTWTEAKGYLALLEKSKQFRTVVVDIVDLLFKACEVFVCAKMGITHPSDEEWGKGWAAVRDEFARFMSRLIGGPRGVILVSHAREKELKRRSGDSSHRMVPTMANQARDILEPMVDIWAYYTYNEKGGRVLSVVGDDFIAAGHRCEKHFVGVKQISMGTSPQEAYRNYVAAFNNEGKKGGDAPQQKKIVVRH